MPYFQISTLNTRKLEMISARKHQETASPFSAVLYIHIPKTGGTSIANYLAEYYSKDLSASTLSGTVPADKSFVPNKMADASKFTQLTGMTIMMSSMPIFNRSVPLQHHTFNSIYSYRDSLGVVISQRTNIIASVRNPYTRVLSALFADAIINTASTPEQVYESLRTWVYNSDNTLASMPQYEFVIDALGNKVASISIVRQESLAFDMAALGYANFNVFDKVNRHVSKSNYMTYLNADSIALINDVYAKDFRMFGYDMF